MGAVFGKYDHTISAVYFDPDTGGSRVKCFGVQIRTTKLAPQATGAASRINLDFIFWHLLFSRFFPALFS
jgi:hypothetical protein